MTEFVRYVTQSGERWDTVSQRCYGTPFEFARIIQANPAVPIRPIIAEGTVLAVPLLDRSQSMPVNLLPPWKR